MCWGYSQSSLVGAKTATLLLPAHLESRLSGSAESLDPSLLPSPHPHPSIHPSLCFSCCVSPLPPSCTVCVAAGAQLKCKISSHFFLSPTHFPSLLSLSFSSLLFVLTLYTSDEGQNSPKKTSGVMEERMWKTSQRGLLFLSL